MLALSSTVMFWIHEKDSEIFLACTTVLATAQLIRHHNILDIVILLFPIRSYIHII